MLAERAESECGRRRCARRDEAGGCEPLSLNMSISATRMRIAAVALLMLVSSASPSRAQSTGGESFSAFWKHACDGALVPVADTGVVFGRVTRVEEELGDSSEVVQAVWSDSDDARDPFQGTRPTVSRVHVKPDGTYALCCVPIGHKDWSRSHPRWYRD